MSGSKPSIRHITPVWPADGDKVLLIRLYPDAAGISDAAAKAMAQGEETGALGEDWESSQYEPPLALP